MESLVPALIGLLGVIVGSLLAFFTKVLEQRRQRREEELSAVRLVSLELLTNAQTLELILLLRHAAPPSNEDVDYWAGEAATPRLEDSAWREYRRVLSYSLGQAWSDVAEAYLGLRHAEWWISTRVPQTHESLQDLLRKVRSAGLMLGWAGQSITRLRILREKSTSETPYRDSRRHRSSVPESSPQKDD